MATSSAKAKYVVVAGCCASILWMKSQLSDYDIHYKMVSIFCDNTSAIAISNNPSIIVAFDLFPSNDESEKCPLNEFLIKFLVLNGQRPLTLDFNTFYSSTSLDYNDGKYVDHPTPEVLDGNYSSTEQVNSIQQLLAYSLITGTEIDTGEIIYSDLVTKLLNEAMLKYTVTSTSPKSQGPKASWALSKKSKRPKSKKPPTETLVTSLKPTKDSEQSHSVSSGTVPDLQDLERDIQLASMGLPSTLDEGTRKSNPLPEGADKEMDDNPQSDETQHQSSPPKEDKPTSYTAPHTKAFDTDSSSDTILKKDQTDNLVEASMSFLKKSSSTINDLYKGLKVITQLLKEITNSVKDDPATNKKIEEASETLGKISTHTTEILSSVIRFDFSALQSTVKNIQDHAFKQEEASGQSSSAFLSSVTSTFDLTDTPTNVKGGNATHTATKEPPSHTKGETDVNIQDNPKEPKQSKDANTFIGPSSHLPAITQAQPITIIHPKPYDKKEEIKKVEEEARLNAISKPEVIKVVREEAKKLGIHPKEAITIKAGELLKKA
nr:uncharacterized mitochondrial protein AtMg00810-like [Tanacetum cinerariifolium]